MTAADILALLQVDLGELYPSKQRTAYLQQAIGAAQGFIAREVGRRMQLRALPKFKFLLDDSIAYSVHISQVIDSLGIKKDSEGKDEE